MSCCVLPLQHTSLPLHPRTPAGTVLPPSVAPVPVSCWPCAAPRSAWQPPTPHPAAAAAAARGPVSAGRLPPQGALGPYPAIEECGTRTAQGLDNAGHAMQHRVLEIEGTAMHVAQHLQGDSTTGCSWPTSCGEGCRTHHAAKDHARQHGAGLQEGSVRWKHAGGYDRHLECAVLFSLLLPSLSDRWQCLKCLSPHVSTAVTPLPKPHLLPHRQALPGCSL